VSVHLQFAYRITRFDGLVLLLGEFNSLVARDCKAKEDCQEDISPCHQEQYSVSVIHHEKMPDA
jgi:hypothetical protein